MTVKAHGLDTTQVLSERQIVQLHVVCRWMDWRILKWCKKNIHTNKQTNKQTRWSTVEAM